MLYQKLMAELNAAKCDECEGRGEFQPSIPFYTRVSPCWHCNGTGIVQNIYPYSFDTVARRLISTLKLDWSD